MNGGRIKEEFSLSIPGLYRRNVFQIRVTSAKLELDGCSRKTDIICVKSNAEAVK